VTAERIVTEDRLWPLLHISELGSIPPPKWLVDGIFSDGLTVMYGVPGGGKTFLALSLAMSIGSGHAWHGHKVEKAPVVYVSGEGVGGLDRRAKAWQIAEGQQNPQVYVIPFGVRFGSVRDHAAQLCGDIHSTGAGLVVIDTLARSMAGADENSAQDMGQHVQAADWLREKTGCGVLIVHHSGVEGSRPRGSTALFGAADTLIRVEQTGLGIVGVTCEKQKDAAPFRPMAFRLTPAGDSVSLSPQNVQVSSALPTPF